MYDKYTYRVTWSDDDEEFVGLCIEFPSLSFLAKTQDAAFKGIRQLVATVVKDMKKTKETIPEPVATKQFSGKFMVRIPPDLHRELVVEAQSANISLNRYIASKLAHI
jgi:predicted HicB family RNase H-like nuclease